MIPWLRRDPWQGFILLLAPLLVVGGLYTIFASRTPVELPVAWWDQDHSALSRQLGRQLQASPAIRLHSVTSLAEGKAMLANGTAYALIQVPVGASETLFRREPLVLDLRYNGQYLLLARRLSAPLQQALASGLSQQATLSLNLAGVPAAAQPAQLAPVQVQLTALNNQNLDYAAFLVPPLALAVWQILVLLSVLNFYQRPPPGVCPRRALPLLLAWQWGWAGIGLWLLSPLLMLPIGTPLWPLWFGLLPVMGAVTTAALLLRRSGREAEQLVSVGAALLTPAMTYMGVTMPEGDMPMAAQWWGQVIPSTHYLPLLQSYRGVGEANWLALWPLMMLLPLLVWLWRRSA
ncbi:ABC transporter permease [Ferrimonas gelatinilytica]|uniref:ABC transporter permease n=1 Tax=Ferrimonas gelatinilytica TaxID=1255257 RepID=A0ABP9SFY4_9GAMM